MVPSDRNITRAINQGQSIVQLQPKSDAARAFRALARVYMMSNRPTSPTSAFRQRRFAGRTRRERLTRP
jgi:nitrogenase subunit NifH